MSGRRRLRDIQNFNQVGDAQLSSRQKVHDSQPGRVRQRTEGA